MYRSRSSFKTNTDGKFTSGSDPWTGQEVEDSFDDIADSACWIDAEQTLTDGATITFDCTNGYNAKVTLGGNRTLSITNATAGMKGTLLVIQDATGGRSLSFSGTYKTNGGFISTTASSHSLIEFYYNGTTYYYTISTYA